MYVIFFFLKGKGEGVWDYLLHNNQWPITDSTNGDVAADFFYKYKEDVAMLKDVGVSNLVYYQSFAEHQFDDIEQYKNNRAIT